MRDPPASGGQESYRHGSRRVSQLKSISCTNISASMAFEQNRFYQPPHSVNQVAAKIISSANSLETRSHQTESSTIQSFNFRTCRRIDRNSRTLAFSADGYRSDRRFPNLSFSAELFEIRARARSSATRWEAESTIEGPPQGLNSEFSLPLIDPVPNRLKQRRCPAVKGGSCLRAFYR